jgi:hypothetical protein
VDKHAQEAHELLTKAVKSKITASEANVAAVPRLVTVLKCHPPGVSPGPSNRAALNELANEVARRAAEAITKLVLKDARVKERVKEIVRAEGGVPTLRALLESNRKDSTKLHRAAAGALITLDEHEALIENIKSATERIEAAAAANGPEVAELHDALRRDVHTLGELAKQDPEYVDTLAMAGALEAITPLLQLSARMAAKTSLDDAGAAPPPNFADVLKEVCYTIGVMASKANQDMVAESGAIAGLVAVLARPFPQLPPGTTPRDPEARRLENANIALEHEVARRAADAITKLAFENDQVKKSIRQADGVAMLRLLLERRDTKVQRAAAVRGFTS